MNQGIQTIGRDLNGFSNTAETIDTKGAEMNRNVNTLVDFSNQILTTSREQREALAEVNQSIQEITENLISFSELTGLLKTVAGSVAEDSQRLDHHVAKFKVGPG